MQIGDVTTDGDFVHGTSFVEDYERYPDNHLDTTMIEFLHKDT